jgi:hypothetical protein
MQTENNINQEESLTDFLLKGCFYPLIGGLISVVLLSLFAVKSIFFVSCILVFFTLIGFNFVLQGVVILYLPIYVFKLIFHRDTTDFEEDNFEQNRLWMIFPISVLVFWIGYFFISRVESDAIIYPIIGLINGGILYYLFKKRYVEL